MRDTQSPQRLEGCESQRNVISLVLMAKIKTLSTQDLQASLEGRLQSTEKTPDSSGFLRLREKQDFLRCHFLGRW